MSAQDRREAAQLEKLFKPPRRPPLLGQGPETLAKVMDNIAGDQASELDHAANQRAHTDLSQEAFNAKEKP